MILLEFEPNSLISLFIFDSTYTLMFLSLILFEFKGDVQLLHNKQEVELKFCGSEGWVKDIYSGY